MQGNFISLLLALAVEERRIMLCLSGWFRIELLSVKYVKSLELSKHMHYRKPALHHFG